MNKIIQTTFLPFFIFLTFASMLIVTDGNSFVPLDTPFPFIVGQNFLFRIMSLGGLICSLFYIDFVKDFFRNTFVRAFCIYLVVITISGLVGFNPLNSFFSTLERMQGILTQYHILFFMLTLYVFDRVEPNAFKKVTTYFFITAITVFIIGHIQTFFRFYSWIFHYNYREGYDFIDFTSTLGNRSYSANLLTNLYIVLGFYLLKTKIEFKKAWIVFAILFFILTQFFVENRGSLVALIAGVIIYFSSLILQTDDREQRNKYKKYFMGTAFGLSFIVLLVLAIGQIPDVFENRLSLEKILNNPRLIMWKIAWKGFLDHPLWGWGYENFFYVFNKYFDPQYPFEEEWVDLAHNVFIDHLVSTGIVGLISYLSIWFALIYTTKKSQASKEQKSLIYASITLIIIRQFFVFEAISGQIALSLIFILIIKNTENVKEDVFAKKIEPPSQPKKIKENNKQLKEKNTTTSKLSIKASSIILPISVFVISLIYIKTTISDDLIAYNGFKQVLTSKKITLDQKIFQIEKIFETKPIQNPTLVFAFLITVNNLPKMQGIPPQILQSAFYVGKKFGLKAIEDDPQNVKFKVLLGQFLYSYNDLNFANQILEQALELSPKKQKTLLHLTQVAMLQGDIPRALKWSKTAFDFGNPSKEVANAYNYIKSLSK